MRSGTTRGFCGMWSAEQERLELSPSDTDVVGASMYQHMISCGFTWKMRRTAKPTRRKEGS